MPNTSDPRTRPSPLTDAQYADLLQIRANLPARSLGAVRGLLQLGLVEKSTPRGQPYALTFKGAALLRLHEQHLMVAEAESLAAAGHARLDALRATLVQASAHAFGADNRVETLKAELTRMQPEPCTRPYCTQCHGSKDGRG